MAIAAQSLFSEVNLKIWFDLKCKRKTNTEKLLLGQARTQHRHKYKLPLSKLMSEVVCNMISED